MTPTELRWQSLSGLMREVQVASRGERTVWLLMNQAGIYGLLRRPPAHRDPAPDRRPSPSARSG